LTHMGQMTPLSNDDNASEALRVERFSSRF
jgi:hypothetical protein